MKIIRKNSISNSLKKREFFNELQRRNVIYNNTPEEELRELLDSGGGIYIGFDLTAPSLHWGHFLLLQILNRATEYQIKTVIILGDFTTPIGDASLRKEDRRHLEISTQRENLQSIRSQLNKLCPNSKIVLNSSFYSDFSISFLLEIFPFFNLSQLLSKDFLKGRMKNHTLTLKDMFYTVLQAYDFYQLSLKENILIQMGGQDQWGNITTGIEFIRKQKKFISTGGFTIPLLTDPSGEKFGKTGKNPLFLDDSLTSPYKCFQYFWNLSDDKIKELSSYIFEEDFQNRKDVESTELREKVIKSMFSKVYSVGKFEKIRSISKLLFSNNSFDKNQLEIISQEIPYWSCNEIPVLSEILIKLGLSNSHSESKRLVEQKKCIYCFKYQCKNHKEKLDINKGNNSYFLIKKGEKEFGIFQLVS